MRLIQIGLLAFIVTLSAACQKTPETQEPVAAPAPVAEMPAAPATPVVVEPAASPLPEATPPTIQAVDNVVKPEAAAVAACPTGCVLMNCPPPIGPKKCCKLVSGIYKSCL